MAAPAVAAPPRRFLTLRRILLTTVFGFAILGGALTGVLLTYQQDIQAIRLEDYRPNIITTVYAADGKTVVGTFAIEQRIVVGFEDIPAVLRNAIVAVEDAGFWKHVGINVWRIPGAALANLRSGRRSQGFSTLTMQLSRLLFLTPEKTYERKIKEVILAFQIERKFTKEEIFTLYCNQIYFGHGRYGVEAASQFYFGKSIKKLTLAEAALLAGLPQNPNRLSPIEFPERAFQRRNHVLERMHEEKHISREEADLARIEPIRLDVKKDPPSIAPYFLEEVRKYLEREYGSQRIYQGGLLVSTTLDPALQRVATRALRRGLCTLDRRARGFVPPTASLVRDGKLPEPLHLDEWDAAFGPGDIVRGVVVASDRGGAVVQLGAYRARVGPREIAWTGRTNVGDVLPRGTVAPFLIETLDPESREAQVVLEQEPKVEGALLAVDVRTGAVKAMVGGFDFERSKFNRATQAMRQVGSAFKPIVYAAALERGGYTPATTIVDSPVSFPDPWSKTVWAPHNYDYAYLGPIPLRRALEQSRNIPAIKTLQAIGIETGIEYARKLGLAGELPPYLPIALGAGEATLQEMTSAFASFANEGLRMKPMYITRITAPTPRGAAGGSADAPEESVIEEARPQAKEAIRADTAYLLTSLLKGVVERGTAIRARTLKRPIAGKTGTTDDWTDGWFVGFEPSLAAGVWVGFDEKKDSLGRGQDGARTALPIWMEFWKEATKDRPVEDFPIPGNIVFVPVDSYGQPGHPGAAGVQMEAFVAGTEPRPAWGAGGRP
jgi:penicillin-binding protein 1A